MLWKMEGLSEYDIRRPMTPTGTNLLGIVKHVSVVESAYFGECFGRPFAETPPWDGDDDDPNNDMWATANESRDQIVDLYRSVWRHSDETITSLPLDATGRVSWWPEERAEVTLHQILIHMIAETNRHAGHADIVRELIDGRAGHREAVDNMAPLDENGWAAYRERLERVAKEVDRR
ncbi:MAG: DinB family protein [Actinobacteria bacterium]|nr:DinB family protein [Actinomycetota bacterium]